MSLRSMKGWVVRHPVAVIMALSLLLQLALFPFVSVNHDTGLYLHDARMVAGGHVPLLEFETRSPLFHVLLLPAVLLDFSPLLTARAMMILLTLALGGTVYLVTRRLHSRGAAVAACALFLLSPFVLIWGLWVKTEQAAALLFLVGLLPLVPRLDDDRIPLRHLIFFGVLLAAAFFVRRVVIIHFGMSLLFLLWYRHRALGRPPGRSLGEGLAFAGSAAVALVLGCLAWAGGSPGDAARLLDALVMGLFGGPTGVGTTAGSAGGGPVPGVTSLLAGTFTERNVVIGVRTLVVTMPAVLLVLLYPVLVLRRRAGVRGVVAAAGTLAAAVGAVGVWLPLNRIKTVSFLTVAALGFSAAALLAAQRQVRLSHVWNRKLWLLVGLSVLVGLGYAVAGGTPYITQFQDIFPYVAALGGIVLWALWQRLDRRAFATLGLGGVLLLGGAAAFVSAEPLVPGFGRGRADYINLPDVVAVGRDLRSRFGPEAVGFSAQPVYLVEAGHEVAGRFARKYWTVYRHPESPRSRQYVSELAEEIRSGEVRYVLFRDGGGRTANVMAAGLGSAFREHFCAAELDADSAALYRRAGVNLYVYDRGAPGSCPPGPGLPASFGPG